MPNRPPPPGPTRVTLQPGGALAANVGIDQVTPSANVVQISGAPPLPLGAATDATLAVATATAGATALIAQRILCEQSAQQRALLQLQAASSGLAIFLPEVPAFLTGS